MFGCTAYSPRTNQTKAEPHLHHHLLTAVCRACAAGGVCAQVSSLTDHLGGSMCECRSVVYEDVPECALHGPPPPAPAGTFAFAAWLQGKLDEDGNCPKPPPYP
eukprot:5973376-Pyramimonas_sp.AAC.1